jgi:hypothetical protein
MWGLETIRQINEEAATAARGDGNAPYCIGVADSLDEWPPFPFPHLGYACDDVDQEHDRLDTCLVDRSGFGAEDEPALTALAFRNRLGTLREQHGALMVALEEIGQFQVYIAIWKGQEKVDGL